MKPVIVLQQAQEELRAAIAWHEEKEAGLGSRFLDSINEAFGRLREHPMAYPLTTSKKRRCLVRAFPYSILFEEKKTDIEVYAIMHHRRHPKSWTK